MLESDPVFCAPLNPSITIAFVVKFVAPQQFGLPGADDFHPLLAISFEYDDVFFTD